MERIGTLSNDGDGSTPFYNDLITRQIADDNSSFGIDNAQDGFNNVDVNANTKNWGHTLESIYVPYGYPDTKYIAQGNHIAYKDPDNGRYYVMRLTNVTDSMDDAGNHYKMAVGVNLAIWKLGKTVHFSKKIKHCNSRTAFSNLFSDTGWYVDPKAEIIGATYDIEFDGRTSNQNMLQTLCQQYGAEVDAYVVFDYEFKVALKRVEVKRRMGEDNGARVTYGNNILSITREVVDSSLFTKLYVFGVNDSTCANSENKYQSFVKDDVANKVYNPPVDGMGTTYLEGVITSNTISEPGGLYDWGMRQLKLFNHPRANYTVTIDNTFSANLGDTVRVLDLEMTPELTVLSRVIQRKISFSDPTQNQIVLGEFTTVNVIAPGFIRTLQDRMSAHVAELLDTLRTNPNALSIVVEKPNGTTWEPGQTDKSFIAHVSILGEDITPLIQPQGFVWHHYVQGMEDTSFTVKHLMDGQYLKIHQDIVGEIRLSIDTEYITSTTEVAMNTRKMSEAFEVTTWKDHWGDKRPGTLQYVNYDPVNNQYFASLAYLGSQEVSQAKEKNSSKDTMFARLSPTGELLDSMIVHWGGHGGAFGLEMIGNKPYIWTQVFDWAFYNESKKLRKRYNICRIPYAGNRVLANSDSSMEKYLSMSQYCRTNYDPSSDMITLSTNAPNFQDLIYTKTNLMKANNTTEVKPDYTINRIDVGFMPKDGTEEDKESSLRQTFQSMQLRFPYLFWATGDINMSDDRLIWCYNIKTNTLIFKKNLNLDEFDFGGSIFAEPETINWTLDENQHPVFLLGFNFKRDGNSSRSAGIWKVGYEQRENDPKKTIIDDPDDITIEVDDTDEKGEDAV